MRRTICFGTLIIVSLMTAQAWGQEAKGQAVPRLIRFSGVVRQVGEKPARGVVELSFSLFKEESGGEPLWFETQAVEIDAQGRYNVLLGAMHADGLPMDLFTSGEARWLSIMVGKVEQPRVLLVSVPYALKAADAESLGGKPATAYVASDELKSQVESSLADPRYAQRTLNATVLASSGGTTTPPAITETNPSTFTCSSAGTCVVVTQNGAGTALLGNAPGTSGVIQGVRGQTASPTGRGVYGLATATTGANYGVRGDTASTNGTGILGNATAATGATYGLSGLSASTAGVGLLGRATAVTGATIGLRGIVDSPNGTAAVFENRGGGKIISGRTTGFVEKFSVDGAGNVNSSGTFTGNGSGLTNVNALTLGGLLPANFALVGSQNTFTQNQYILAQLAVTGLQDNTGNLQVHGSLFQNNGTVSFSGNAAGFPIVSITQVAADGSALEAHSPTTVGGQATIRGYADGITGSVAGVQGFAASTDNGSAGVEGTASGASGTIRGVYGKAINSSNGVGVFGYGKSYGVQGTHSALSGSGGGVLGDASSSSGAGVRGFQSGSTTPTGIVADGGVYGESFKSDGNGVMGVANTGTSAYGVYGESTSGFAGYFSGKVFVDGKLQASGGFNGQCLSSGDFGTSVGNACNMDLAEGFATAERTEPGDLVALDTHGGATPAVHKSAHAYEGLLAGVVSANPGLVFEEGRTHLSGDNSQLISKDRTVVALAGRVVTKVSMENGSIAIGDPVTTSSKPGIGMKATRTGKVVGYALEPTVKDGLILVLVQPGYFVSAEGKGPRRPSVEDLEMKGMDAKLAALARQIGFLVEAVKVQQAHIERLSRKNARHRKVDADEDAIAEIRSHGHALNSRPVLQALKRPLSPQLSGEKNPVEASVRPPEAPAR